MMTNARLVCSAALSLAFCACAASVDPASPCSSNLRSAAALTTASLGTAQTFSVLAGTTVTNAGPTTLSGDLGVGPGSALVGFPPGQVLAPGTTHAGDGVSQQAQSDLTAAYLAAAGAPCTSNKTGIDLGGLTLSPGVYCFTSTAGLTGALTLDAGGNPDAVFVFQITSALTTASASSVRVINGGNPCNVFWQVGSSATLGSGSAFAGNLLVLTSVAVATGASLSGRVLVRNGTVTLDTNQISSGLCKAALADCCSDGGNDAGQDGGADAGLDGGADAGGGLTDGGSCQ
jgi:hypothetical protein